MSWGQVIIAIVKVFLQLGYAAGKKLYFVVFFSKSAIQKTHVHVIQ